MEGDGELVDVDKADIAFAAFNTSYIGTVEPARERQGFLGKAALGAQFAQTGAEAPLDSQLFVAGHDAKWTIDGDCKSTDFKSPLLYLVYGVAPNGTTGHPCCMLTCHWGYLC